jgi:hypothetical protein
MTNEHAPSLLGGIKRPPLSIFDMIMVISWQLRQ